MKTSVSNASRRPRRSRSGTAQRPALRIDFTTDDRDWLLAPVFAEAQLGPLHCWRVSGTFDLERAVESYRLRLVRAKGHDLTESDDPEEEGPWSDLLLYWPDDRFWAHLEPDRIRVYAPGPEVARRLAETLRDDLARRPCAQDTIARAGVSDPARIQFVRGGRRRASG